MKLARSRRAVSPVIATLLLILIAVAAAVLVYMWVTGYIRTTPIGGHELSERIKIEAIHAPSGTGTKTIYVRNIGDIAATIQAIYILDLKGSVIASNTALTSSLPPGTVRAITVSATLTSGTTYTFKVVTSTGIEASYVFKVP